MFGHVNRRFGTPDYAFVLMATVATALTIVNYAVFGGNQTIFWTIFSLSSIVFMAPYTLMFPALLVLRRKRPETPRPYRVPGGRTPALGSPSGSPSSSWFSASILFITVIPAGGSRLVYTAITSGGTIATLLVGVWLSRRRAPQDGAGG